MLRRWLACGLDPARATVLRPSGRAVAQGVAVVTDYPASLPAGTTVVLGMKPYQLGEVAALLAPLCRADVRRSEEHTSELQSLMRISYAVFCLKKKRNTC